MIIAKLGMKRSCICGSFGTCVLHLTRHRAIVTHYGFSLSLLEMLGLYWMFGFVCLWKTLPKQLIWV